MLDNEFPPLGGGTGVVNKHLLEELSRYRNVWVDLVTSSRTRRSYEKEQFADRITIYKVPVDNENIHHSSNIELLRYSFRGLWFCRSLIKQHAYDMTFAFAGVPAGGVALVVKMIAGVPYLVSLQGPDVPGFEDRYSYLYPVLTPIIKLIWRHASAVIAISKDHRQLAQSTMPAMAIPIIANGVDTGLFAPSTKSVERDEVVIVCVGRLIERKGQHHLLRAMAKMGTRRRVRLILAGTGDAEKMLRALVIELGLEDSVTFTGFVSRTDIPSVYHRADIFVLPSESEGMSIALLEAMASGLPVVVTPTGGTDELVEGGKNGFIVPWADVEALAGTLGRLVDDAELRRRMGERSRQTALKFSWPEITSEYVKLFEHITGQHIHAS